MPKNEWIDKEKTPWMGPEKSLDEVRDERQNKSDKEGLEPDIEFSAPEPEHIEHKEIADSIEAAAEALLDAGVAIKKAEVKLTKSTLGLAGTGEGAEITEKINQFKERLSKIDTEIVAVSKEMGTYQETLPTESEK